MQASACPLSWILILLDANLVVLTHPKTVRFRRTQKTSFPAGPSDFVGSFILNLVLPEIAGIVFFVTWLGAMSWPQGMSVRVELDWH